MAIHIGEKIKTRAEELKIGTTELGKLANTTKQNIYAIYKRPSIDTELLFQLSKILKFDFFQFYELGKIKSTDIILQKKVNGLMKENEKLQSEVKTLREKNELLQKVNDLLEQNNKRTKTNRGK